MFRDIISQSKPEQKTSIWTYFAPFLPEEPVHSATSAATIAAMSTVADELLNDFGSSGDEAEENDNDGLVNDEPQENGDHDVMDVDGDQEGSDDEEGNDMKEMGDAEATKAKVEKMQLGAVKDVRSVASLMQTLEPVLEVSIPLPSPNLRRRRLHSFERRLVYIQFLETQP